MYCLAALKWNHTKTSFFCIENNISAAKMESKERKKMSSTMW